MPAAASRPSGASAVAALGVLALLHGCGAAREPIPEPTAPVAVPVPTSNRCAGAGDACVWFEERASDLNLVPTDVFSTAGGGVALGDVDGDGLVDLVHAARAHVHLWLQRADGGFDDVSAGWGLDGVSAEMSTVLVDWDGDGDLDLAASGADVVQDLWLLRNDSGLFVDVTAEAGIVSGGLASSTAWADYDLDGDLDFYVARYSAAVHNDLWRNDGGGLFTEVTDDAGVANPGGLSFQPVWLDLEGDGDPDLYVANDRSTVPALFRNDGGGLFVDISVEAGVALAVEAMGVAAGDLDRDGDMDLYVGNVPHLPIWDISNLLHLNDGTGTFLERARLQGAALDRWTWGACAFDPDLDGDLDLFAAVDVGVDGLGSALLENVDGRGTFVDATDRAGVGWVGNSYAAVAADLNGDGAPELVVTGRITDPLLLVYVNRHVGARHWLKVRLQGTASNLFAIGARVIVETDDGIQLRELRAGEGLRGSGPPELLFGLGSAIVVGRIQVLWPGGAGTSEITDVAADTIVTLVAPSGG